MAIIQVPPRFAFSSLPTFKLQRASNQVRSRFTGHRQTKVYPFALWMIEGELIECDGLDAGRLRSFLTQLDGVANKFRLPVPGYSRPSTGYNLNCLAYTAAASRAQSMTISGLTASVPIVNEGDYFNVNDELKLITSAIASDANGRATLSFKPALRSSVTVNSAITLVKPTILMHADDDDVANWSIKPPYRQGGKFRASESIEL